MKLHFEVHGRDDAPPLLLIMGLSLGSRAWEGLPGLLAADFRVITFDNRGTGRSARGGVAYRMEQLADDAATVLDRAAVAKAHVFGISMGGMIAQELALRHPSRVDRLALGCTFACWRTSKRPSLRTLGDLMLLNTGVGRTEERIGRLLASREFEQQNPGRVMQWIGNADRTTPRYAVAQMLAIRRHACESRLSQIQAPTLVLTGTEDRLVPPQNSEMLAKLIPNARLEKLEGAGHVFPLERERDTVRLLTEHFAPRGAAGARKPTG